VPPSGSEFGLLPSLLRFGVHWKLQDNGTLWGSPPEAEPSPGHPKNMSELGWSNLVVPTWGPCDSPEGEGLRTLAQLHGLLGPSVAETRRQRAQGWAPSSTCRERGQISLSSNMPQRLGSRLVLLCSGKAHILWVSASPLNEAWPNQTSVLLGTSGTCCT
jgi:hypothetical protein